MPNRVISLVVCTLLSGPALADESASSALNAHAHVPSAAVKPKEVVASQHPNPHRDVSPIRPWPPNLWFYGTSILDLGASEWRALEKFAGLSGSNAVATTGATSRRIPFLLRQDRDEAGGLLTTNVALRLKLSADGVYLNLAF